jgi:hypothetical protein
MIGNGQSSRFTIRKGALQCYVELTLAGHQIYILKEDGTVCSKKYKKINKNKLRKIRKLK